MGYLPVIVNAFIFSLLLISVGWGVYHDAGAGFLSRICILLSAFYFFASWSRWAITLDSLYSGLPDINLEILAISLLLVVPVSLLTAPVWRTMTLYDYWIKRNA